MVEFDESKQKLAALREVITEVADALDVPALEQRKAALEEEQNQDGFWTDQAKSQRVNKELKQVGDKLAKVKKLQSRAEDIGVLIELAEMEEALDLPRGTVFPHRRSAEHRSVPARCRFQCRPDILQR